MVLSGENFDREEIEYMERILLDHIGWFLYPPTPMAFVHLLLGCLDVPSNFIDQILEDSQYLTELAACGKFNFCCYYEAHSTGTVLVFNLFSLPIGAYLFPNSTRTTYSRLLLRAISTFPGCSGLYFKCMRTKWYINKFTRRLASSH